MNLTRRWQPLQKRSEFNIYHGLVSFDQGRQDYPGVWRESWEVSEDGRVYTFLVRKGVLFHNGRELTASDVIFSLERSKMTPRVFLELGLSAWWKDSRR